MVDGSSLPKIAQLYLRAAQGALHTLRRQWYLLPATMLLAFVGLQVMRFVSTLGPTSGILSGILFILFTAVYLGWLSRVDERKTIPLRDYLALHQGLFYATLNAAFILFVAQFIVQTLTADLNAGPARLGLGLLLFIFFNSLPESIYISSNAGAGALGQAALFTRDHWIEWFLPQLVLLSPSLLLSPDAVLVSVANSDPLLPLGLIVQATLSALSPVSIIGLVGSLMVATLISSWYMLFRAELYRALESGRWRR